jgi:NADP-dependent 3-hydroxy acid dehydrogenase YdfG
VKALNGVALVTGASGGIGCAIARALGARGMSLCLTGRDADRLQSCAQEMRALPARVVEHQADLASDEAIRGLAAWVTGGPGRVDVLVHAAGALSPANLEAADGQELDEQYRVNLRAPFLLTQALLPQLKQSRGQVVFVNSSAALAPGADNVLYAATKSAQRALADGLRQLVNPWGVRVLSVYAGRTASAMQEAVHRFEGRPYAPADLLQPEDVAEIVAESLSLPRTAEVIDLTVRPMLKSSSGRSA